MPPTPSPSRPPPLRTSRANSRDSSAEAHADRETELAKLRGELAELQTEFAADDSPAAAPGRAGELLIDIGQRPRPGDVVDENAARSQLLGGALLSPNSVRKGNKTVRFRDALVDTDEMEGPQVMQLHQRVMEEQDESLDRLSASIRNQRELSIQIGDELDQHVQLLDDVDGLVDRHHGRLNNAKRRLDSVAKTAKEHGGVSRPDIAVIGANWAQGAWWS